MKENDNPQEFPEYSLEELMTLLKIDEASIRRLIKEAGIEIDLSKNDPSETIQYDDFRKLWVSRANRRDGRLLATLLVEPTTSWFDWIGRKGK